MKTIAPPESIPASAPQRLARRQNSENRTTGPKAAPKPAHAKETIWKTELDGSRARKTAMTAMPTSVRRAAIMLALPKMFRWNTPYRMFWETAEEAARSWESAVDMVDARIPARIRPATIANRKPCWLSTSAMRTMMVSESEPVRVGMTPALDMDRPTTPMKTATAREMTTQMDATRRDRLSLRSSSMAMKRSRTWGIPK